MRTLFVIEPVLTGHHLNYLFEISSGLKDRFDKIFIITSLQAKSRQIEDAFSKYENFFVLKEDFSDVGKGGAFWRIFLDRFKYYFWYRRVFRKYAPKYHPDFVLVPYGDSISYHVAMFGSPFKSAPWSLICMRTSFARVADFKLQNFLKIVLFGFLLARKSLKNVFSIDPLFSEFCRKEYSGFRAGKVIYVPDPAEDIVLSPKALARSEIHADIQPEDYLILVYGALGLRKGIASIVTLLAHQESDADIKLLLVGEVDDDLSDLIRSESYVRLKKAGRIIEKFGRASKSFQDLVFSASDACWVGYVNHLEMSGVLLLSEKFGVPSFVSTDGLLGWFNREYNFGIPVNELSENLFFSKENLIEKFTSFRLTSDITRKELMNSHSWAFALKIIKSSF